jgi:hypothetical protein
LEAELIHIGAVICFGGFAGSYWAGLRDAGKVWWLYPAVTFLLAAAFMAAWN